MHSPMCTLSQNGYGDNCDGTARLHDNLVCLRRRVASRRPAATPPQKTKVSGTWSRARDMGALSAGAAGPSNLASCSHAAAQTKSIRYMAPAAGSGRA